LEQANGIGFVCRIRLTPSEYEKSSTDDAGKGSWVRQNWTHSVAFEGIIDYFNRHKPEKTKIMEQKEQFRQEAKKSIDEFFAEINMLEEKKDQMEEEVHSQYDEMINEMKGKIEHLRNKLDEIGEKTDENWEKASEEFKQSFESFKDGFAKLASFGKRSE